MFYIVQVHVMKKVFFNCGDNTCIDKSLKCNGNFNCDFEFDEKGCKDFPSTQESVFNLSNSQFNIFDQAPFLK